MNTRTKSLGKKAGCGVAAIALAAVFGVTGFSVNVFSAFAEKYTVDKTYEELLATSADLNTQIMQEGMVLLKNDGVLPLMKNSKVSVMGIGSFKTYWGETGGGNGKTDYCYLTDSLKEVFDVNPDVESAYNAANVKTITMAGANTIIEPADVLKGITASLSTYGDAAIITLSRTGKESNDLVTTGADAYGWDNATDHQLMLYKAERDLITLAKDNCKKVIVLLNCPTTMQIPELEEGGDYEVNAIMYIGMPGQYGLRAVGSVLCGDVNPSGRTVSLWATDYTKDPTFANFTNSEENLGDINGTKSVEYEEGIYLGYKYYETAAAEAKDGNYNGFVYDDEVLYPFGYGLSYTTFTQEFVAGQTIDLSDKSFDDTVKIQVKVTNATADNGGVAGKEVVQIYNHAPYTTGGIEKSEVILVGFAKTGILEPGESETVTVEIRVGDLASFDYNDANGNHWYGYEIESAEGYELRLQKDSHNKIESLSYTVGETIAFNNDGSIATITGTDNKDNLVFSNGDDFDSLYLATSANGGDFIVMSRADFAGTFPTSPESHTYTNGINTRYMDEYTPDMDETTDPWYVSAVPDDWTQGSTSTSYTLSDMTGVDYDDAKWTAFMNQLTWTEMTEVIAKANHTTQSLESVLKPTQNDVDGPEQIGDGTFWACANIIAGTFNVELAEERGIAIGQEGLYQGYAGWYGPTANLNRSPFGGRNGIYFSEDSYLTGKISASTVAGATSQGLICYLKHFAINEQETARQGLATFLTEQALRETYLKAFEYAVKEGGTLGVMQAMNRLGGVNCYGNYALDVTVLREEWDFKGVVITDSYSSSFVYENMAQRMGGDIPLGSWPNTLAGEWKDGTVVYDGEESLTQWSVVRNSAQHLLYAAANSNQVYNGYNSFAVFSKAYEAITLNKGEESEIDVSIDTDMFGTSNVKYSVSGLPAGLSVDPVTGIISGKPTEVGDFKITVTVTVNNEGEKWISLSSYAAGNYTFMLTVEKGNSGLAGWAWALIAVAIVVVVAAAVMGTLFVLKKKKAKPVAEMNDESINNSENENKTE